jgi:hypothetical protein
MLDELIGNIETFITLDEVYAHIEKNNIELPIIYQLELDYDSDVDDELFYKLNFVNDDGSITFSEYYLYKHDNRGIQSYSYTKDFFNGSRQVFSIDECLSNWYDYEGKSKSNNDEYDVSCSSCGDGGCVHCEPWRFI